MVLKVWSEPSGNTKKGQHNLFYLLITCFRYLQYPNYKVDEARFWLFLYQCGANSFSRDSKVYLQIGLGEQSVHNRWFGEYGFHLSERLLAIYIP